VKVIDLFNDNKRKQLEKYMHLPQSDDEANLSDKDKDSCNIDSINNSLLAIGE